VSVPRRIFAACVGLLAVVHGAPAAAGALQNVFVSRSDGIAAIEFRFTCFHRLAGPSTEGPATVFEISLTRIGQCGSRRAGEGAQESTRPAGRESVALEEVDYFWRDRDEAVLRLQFARPVQIDVLQSGDLTGLRVRPSETGGTAATGIPDGAAGGSATPLARTPERLARADAAALERAARRNAPAAEPAANYALNLATSRTEVFTPDPRDVARAGEQLYVTKTELGTEPVYRLRLGFFATEAQAEQALSRVANRFPTAWVAMVGAGDHEQATYGSLAAPAAPVDTSVATRHGDVATRSADELGALMAQARTAMLAGDFAGAASIYTTVLAEPPNDYSAEARELLGVARQRNGESAQAIAEYRRYLEEYPDSDGAARVSQRLAALTTARDAPKSGLREAGRGAESGAWDTFGSFSQYYRHDAADLAGQGMSTKVSMVQTDGMLDARRHGDTLDIAGRATLGYDYDLLNEPAAPGNRTRIYDLYADVWHRDRGIGIRVGRQRERSAGVLGRYDGAHVSYQLRPDVKLNVMGGFPVYLSSDSLETDRVFYAASVDLNDLFAGIDTSFFFNTQSIDGVEDRQAVGTELRYFDGARSLVGLVDYDIGFGTLNTLSLLGNWYFDSGLAVSASADYHRSPFPLTENALIGQSAGSIDELLESLTEEQVRQLAEDRSGEMLSYSLGLSQPLGERWQVNVDFTAAQIAEGPGSGGVLALPDSGNEYYVYGSLVGSSLFTEGDVSIFGLRFSDTEIARVSTLYLDSRYPLTNALRLNPRLAVSLRDIAADSSTETLVTPSLRLLYRFARRYEIELEGGGDIGSRSGDANSDTTAYFIYAGYRADF
jgi:tetratricopeptide (TPR) repeat protein